MKAYFLYNHEINIDLLLGKLNISYGSTIQYEDIQDISLLIPWGNIDQNITVPFILNKKANQLINNKYDQYKIFNTQGISTPIFFDEFNGQLKFKKLRYVQIYHVAVFGQNILGYFKQKQTQTVNWLNKNIFSMKENINVSEIQALSTKREERRVSQLAIRAVYSLHLDYALVTVGVTAGEKPWILHVNPYPNLNGKLSSRFAKMINQFASEWEKVLKTSHHQVTLGTDPEFVLRDANGNMVLASTFFPRKGSVGCDDIWTNLDRSQLPIAELRPKPSPDPRQLAVHLYQTMIMASKRLRNPKIEWLAGALPFDGFPIGGHIHFSSIELNSFLLRALDNYLTLTISLFEDPKGTKRRPKYGFLGDYREKFHKGFEYRTLPSWIVSPTLTKGVFALAKLIAENYLYLYQDPLYDIEVQQAYYTGDKEGLKPVVHKLWEELKQLKDFDNYRIYLEPLEKLKNKGYVWNEKVDIRRAWKLPPYHR
ncbi:putative amidoligase domain-containing protein [Tepidibacillus marianensis]|uniref:putative amidoligase domain-containing protein n=1 Tax=Tepidibacillus marianensis TaxID=3131995 RepID=UPI0030D16D64